MTTIKVLDAACGSGKSYYTYKDYEANPVEKYIYVTPYLDEITRLQEQVPSLEFHSPRGASKANDALRLLDSGKNIACTHALYQAFTDEHIQTIKDQGYHLTLDEEIEVFSPFSCSVGDAQHMQRHGSIEIVGKEQRVVLKEPLTNFVEDKERKSETRRIALAASKGTLYCGVKNGQVSYFVTQIPIDLIRAAKTTTIVTYRFKGSLFDHFLDIHDLKWEYLNVKLHKSNEQVISSLKRLITFPEPTRATKKIEGFTLGQRFYETNATEDELKDIGGAYRSIADPIQDKSKILFTCPAIAKDKKLIDKAGRPYPNPRSIVRKKDGPIDHLWLAPNARATNAYDTKTEVIYFSKRSPNQYVVNYIESHGVSVDQDEISLSEMVQFVFRSAVRKGEPINLYVASKKMRELFQNWLNDVEINLLEDIAA